MKVERWQGSAPGRSHTAARGDMVWSVSNATSKDADFAAQVQETFAFLESSLLTAGSSKHQMLSVQVLLSDIGRRDQFNLLWCTWIGAEPEHWPQRAIFQAALAPGLGVELVVTAFRQ